MTIEQLEQKRSEVESQFNEKQAARDKVLSQAASLLEEMQQLKGAYITYTELINSTDTEKVTDTTKEKK